MHAIVQTEAVQIGRHVRHLRRTHDRTLEGLVDMAGVSMSWVSRIKHGVNVPNVSFLFRVGEALPVPTNKLLLPRMYSREMETPAIVRGA